jgi:uncharacterized protein (TIGR03435 family)
MVPLISCAALFGVAGCVVSEAQTPVSYVASVKANEGPDARTLSEFQPGGHFIATAITVRDLLRIAYRVQPYQMVGAPGWILTDRYDIDAKAEMSPAPTQQTLIRALLSDRFKLEIRNETREMPRFALTMARSDGRPGLQLKKSEFDCAAYLAGPHDAPQPGKTPPCAMRIGPGALAAKAIGMTQLATAMSPIVSRFTVDKTGLSGGFDVEMTWTPEPAAAPEAASEAAGPSIFTALQEQLGLKLVSERGPVDACGELDQICKPMSTRH